MLKTAFTDNSLGNTQTSVRFSQFKYRQTSAEDCNESGRLSTGRRDEIEEEVNKDSKKTDAVPFQRSLIGYAPRIEHASEKKTSLANTVSDDIASNDMVTND